MELDNEELEATRKLHNIDKTKNVKSIKIPENGKKTNNEKDKMEG